MKRLAAVTTVLEGEAAGAAYQVEGMMPAVVALPASEAEVAACLRVAAECGAAVIPRGGGTRMELGTPPRRCDVVLSLERLRTVVEYVPEDLTVTVQAGMPLRELQALVGSRGQAVPLDPMGSPGTTVGGVMATAAIGPRRMVYGGPRDVLLGARVVLADGRVIRSGGRVVKNVAGYDLNKLLVGSLGTLGVLTELTLKLRPLPPCRRTFWLPCRHVGEALAAAEAVLDSELLPSAVTVLSGGAAGRLGLSGTAALVVELAESTTNVAYQADRLPEILRGWGTGAVAELAEERQEAFWEGVRDYHRQGGARWRLRIAAVLSTLEEQAQFALTFPGVAIIAHAGSGSLFVYGQDPNPEALSAMVSRAASLGGGAVLEAAPPEVKQAVGVWGPPRPEWRLMRQIKEALDPGGVLNPGRFVGGI
ncbi:MAG TPA: FAD-binding oxidoreductase [Symbiobacteriaceae bacterium]